MNKSLFHYVDDLERLLEILGEGFVPNYHLEDLTGEGHEDLYRGIPMVSFSDINPDPKCSHKHRQNYGNYCIGLKKEWALRCSDINPIMYVSSPALLKIVQSNLIDSDLFGFIKKYTSPWDNDPNHINYDECEWRYVAHDPEVKWMQSKEEYDKWRGDRNKKRPKPTEALRRNVLTFKLEDITHLCVPTENDKEHLVKDIQNLKAFSGNGYQLNYNEIQYLISTISVISSNKHKLMDIHTIPIKSDGH